MDCSGNKRCLPNPRGDPGRVEEYQALVQETMEEIAQKAVNGSPDRTD